MEKELRAKFNLYLTLKEGETDQEAIDRLYKILYKTEKENRGFTISELYEYEIQNN